MISLTSVLCVILLVRAESVDLDKLRKEAKEASKGPGRDYGLAQNILALNDIINEHAVGMVEEAQSIVEFDLKDKLEEKLEKQGRKVDNIPKESAEEKEAEKEREIALKVVGRESLNDVKDVVETYALQAAVQCRGGNDKILQEYLGDKIKARKAEGICELENPEKEEIKEALVEFEQVVFDRLKSIVMASLAKVKSLLQDSDSELDDGESFDEKKISDMLATKTDEALEMIGNQVKLIAAAAKKFDADAEEENKVDKLFKCLNKRDYKGAKEFVNELEKVVKIGDKHYQKIVSIVRK